MFGITDPSGLPSSIPRNPSFPQPSTPTSAHISRFYTQQKRSTGQDPASPKARSRSGSGSETGRGNGHKHRRSISQPGFAIYQDQEGDEVGEGSLLGENDTVMGSPRRQKSHQKRPEARRSITSPLTVSALPPQPQQSPRPTSSQNNAVVLQREKITSVISYTIRDGINSGQKDKGNSKKKDTRNENTPTSTATPAAGMDSDPLSIQSNPFPSPGLPPSSEAFKTLSRRRGQAHVQGTSSSSRTPFPLNLLTPQRGPEGEEARRSGTSVTSPSTPTPARSFSRPERQAVGGEVEKSRIGTGGLRGKSKFLARQSNVSIGQATPSSARTQRNGDIPTSSSSQSRCSSKSPQQGLEKEDGMLLAMGLRGVEGSTSEEDGEGEVTEVEGEMEGSGVRGTGRFTGLAGGSQGQSQVMPASQTSLATASRFIPQEDPHPSSSSSRPISNASNRSSISRTNPSTTLAPPRRSARLSEGRVPSQSNSWVSTRAPSPANPEEDDPFLHLEDRVIVEIEVSCPRPSKGRKRQPAPGSLRNKQGQGQRNKKKRPSIEGETFAAPSGSVSPMQLDEPTAPAKISRRRKRTSEHVVGGSGSAQNSPNPRARKSARKSVAAVVEAVRAREGGSPMRGVEEVTVRGFSGMRHAWAGGGSMETPLKKKSVRIIPATDRPVRRRRRSSENDDGSHDDSSTRRKPKQSRKSLGSQLDRIQSDREKGSSRRKSEGRRKRMSLAPKAVMDSVANGTMLLDEPERPASPTDDPLLLKGTARSIRPIRRINRDPVLYDADLASSGGRESTPEVIDLSQADDSSDESGTVGGDDTVEEVQTPVASRAGSEEQADLRPQSPDSDEEQIALDLQAASSPRRGISPARSMGRFGFTERSVSPAFSSEDNQAAVDESAGEDEDIAVPGSGLARSEEALLQRVPGSSPPPQQEDDQHDTFAFHIGDGNDESDDEGYMSAGGFGADQRDSSPDWPETQEEVAPVLPMVEQEEIGSPSVQVGPSPVEQEEQARNDEDAVERTPSEVEQQTPEATEDREATLTAVEVDQQEPEAGEDRGAALMEEAVRPAPAQARQSVEPTGDTAEQSNGPAGPEQASGSSGDSVAAAGASDYVRLIIRQTVIKAEPPTPARTADAQQQQSEEAQDSETEAVQADENDLSAASQSDDMMVNLGEGEGAEAAEDAFSSGQADEAALDVEEQESSSAPVEQDEVEDPEQLAPMEEQQRPETEAESEPAEDDGDSELPHGVSTINQAQEQQNSEPDLPQGTEAEQPTEPETHDQQVEEPPVDVDGVHGSAAEEEESEGPFPGDSEAEDYTLMQVQITSSDPRAAARAAAILKQSKHYREPGSEITDATRERLQKLKRRRSEHFRSVDAARQLSPGKMIEEAADELEYETLLSEKEGHVANPVTRLKKTASADRPRSRTVNPQGGDLFNVDDWRYLDRCYRHVRATAQRKGKSTSQASNSLDVNLERVLDRFLHKYKLGEDDLVADWQRTIMLTRVKAIQEKLARSSRQGTFSAIDASSVITGEDEDETVDPAFPVAKKCRTGLATEVITAVADVETDSVQAVPAGRGWFGAISRGWQTLRRMSSATSQADPAQPESSSQKVAATHSRRHLAPGGFDDIYTASPATRRAPSVMPQTPSPRVEVVADSVAGTERSHRQRLAVWQRGVQPGAPSPLSNAFTEFQSETDGDGELVTPMVQAGNTGITVTRPIANFPRTKIFAKPTLPVPAASRSARSNAFRSTETSSTGILVSPAARAPRATTPVAETEEPEQDAPSESVRSRVQRFQESESSTSERQMQDRAVGRLQNNAEYGPVMRSLSQSLGAKQEDSQ